MTTQTDARLGALMTCSVEALAAAVLRLLEHRFGAKSDEVDVKIVSLIQADHEVKGEGKDRPAN